MRIGETLVREAMRRGFLLFVDTDGSVHYHPASRMDERFLRLLKQHREKVKRFLIAVAVREDTGEDIGKEKSG